MEKFDKWNRVKKNTEQNKRKLGIKSRDIFCAKIGQNVGSEEYGKGKNFARPVIIIRKLTKELFLGIPTTTNLKDNNDYFHTFKYLDKNKNTLEVSAMILQIKVFSVKRLMNRIGMIDKDSFGIVIEKSQNLMIGPT